MSNVWLVLDGDNLCYRAFYAMGQLSHNDVKTGVVYGFLRDVTVLRQQLNATRVVFCFDHELPRREKILPDYKLKRKTKVRTPEEDKARAELKRQVRLLKEDYLISMGYGNVLYATGFEADDIIASVCKESIPDGDSSVIVSTDSDLLQLLDSRTTIWDHRKNKLWTKESFVKTYRIPPRDWAHVKAIAGCDTDEIKGIHFVGEQTALKHLRGELKIGSKSRQRIKAGWSIWERNLRLVELPFEGCPTFRLKDDDLTVDKWREVTVRLGIKSLAPPVSGFLRREK